MLEKGSNDLSGKDSFLLALEMVSVAVRDDAKWCIGPDTIESHAAVGTANIPCQEIRCRVRQHGGVCDGFVLYKNWCRMDYSVLLWLLR